MIYFIGFMGVGKSTIAKEIAAKFNRKFIDTDKIIEGIEKKTINNIFKEKGEEYFRELEKKTLRKIKQNEIVACGGGTPIFNNNMEYINKTGISIYLKDSINSLLTKLENTQNKRPLIKKLNRSELKKYIELELIEREKIYKTATYTINIQNKSTQEILREIHPLINSF